VGVLGAGTIHLFAYPRLLFLSWCPRRVAHCSGSHATISRLSSTPHHLSLSSGVIAALAVGDAAR